MKKLLFFITFIFAIPALHAAEESIIQTPTKQLKKFIDTYDIDNFKNLYNQIPAHEINKEELISYANNLHDTLSKNIKKLNKPQVYKISGIFSLCSTIITASEMYFFNKIGGLYLKNHAFDPADKNKKIVKLAHFFAKPLIISIDLLNFITQTTQKTTLDDHRFNNTRVRDAREYGNNEKLYEIDLLYNHQSLIFILFIAELYFIINNYCCLTKISTLQKQSNAVNIIQKYMTENT